MERLDPKNFEQAFYVYKQTPPFYAIVGAVLENKQGGLVFTDSNSYPTSFFVVHKFGFAQYFDTTNNDDFAAQIVFLLSKNKGVIKWNLPEKVRIYAPNQQFQNDFGQNQMPHIKKSERVQMRLFDESHRKLHNSEEVEIKNAKYDFDRLNEELELGLNQRFWGSKESFLNDGLGYFVQSKATKEIVSLCYAAAVSNNIAEIDILTAVKYRGKGYASFAANTFVNHCLSMGITPNWDCYTNNESSLNLAVKLGFKKAIIYDFYTVSFN